MSFLLTLTDFSCGEGVYTAEQIARLAPRLGYTDLVLWDRGLHGYPRLREELEFAHTPVRPHLGCRFDWRGHACGALPFTDRGYGELGRLLTDQAHGREGSPPWDCALLAESLEGVEALAKEGFLVHLLAHPRRQREAAEALARGLPVCGAQVLRFRTPAGLELHRLKRAIHTQSTAARTEALWDPRDGTLPRALWEARFPMAEPRIVHETEAILERLSSWRIPWGEWVSAGPLGFEHADLDAELAQRVRQGALKRYGTGRGGQLPGPVESRMAHELDLIRRKRFASYFLLVKDLVSHSEARTCGRGSGAASLVSYCLELTNVDPIDTNLVFERFLTEARKDPPDLDIDFAWDERDAVILSAFERYGRHRVAMVANHVFFKPKGALRAVALAHGRPEAELKTLARFVRGWDGGIERIQEHPHWSPILAQAEALLGHFHQLSVHPGGTVITPGPLWEHVPFQPAPAKEGVSITQWDKEGVEGYGLVKIDLLGNRSLAVIRDAHQVLGDRVPADPGATSRHDPETQALLARGDSIGVFYVESPATRQLQQRVGKGDFETLVIHSSLIRPAAHHWVDTYVKRARGEEVFTASHPVFANLLSDSHGVLIYQEDVVRVAMDLAGWNHDEADALRKLLGKEDCSRKLPAFEARFRQGCAAQGVPEAVVEEAWGMIRTFRGYSFCKPHSASYAQVSFESAWIKAHHPAVFFASVITNQGGYYPAIAYLGDARRHRLIVRGPDANASDWPFTAEGEQGLRVGLMQVKGAREEEVRALLEERSLHGPYADLDELLRRVDLSIPTVEALASGGVFDRWAPDGDRTRLFWARLGGIPPGVRPRPTDPFDRAELEMETLGLTLEIHPAALARARHGGAFQRTEDVSKPGRNLRFWALVVADKVVLTEKDEPMQFISFEDETALCEAVAFPDAYKKRRRPYRVGDVVPVSGRSTLQDGLAMLEVR
jgi:error-prone DNA polymerase